MGTIHNKSLLFLMITCENVQSILCSARYPSTTYIHIVLKIMLRYLRYSTRCKKVQSWTKVRGTAWKYDTCSLIALFSTLWRVAFAQSDVPPPPGQCCSEKVHFQPTDTTLRGGGGRGKSKRGDFQRKSAGAEFIKTFRKKVRTNKKLRSS